MLKRTKITIGVVVIAALALASAAVVLVPASLSFGNQEQVEFLVEKGDGLNAITDNLKERGFLRYPFLFKAYTTLLGQNKNLKAGRYQLSYSMSVSDLVHVFSGGLFESDDIVVTIPEGSDIDDVDMILSKTGLVRRGILLNRNDIILEGYLFPDTYRFLPGTTKEEILKDLQDNFAAKTADLFGVFISIENRRKVIIVASMLEKEVRSPLDMALVAGVIENRLERDMTLSIDASVAYGQCYEKFVSGISCEPSQANIIAGIAGQSPFNTYKRKGLPPAPISNPGLNAIRAALNPEDSDYLYYLSDPATGRTIFSKTGAEHEANRRKYLGR